MVRRITNGGRKIIGKFPSRKMGRAIWYESQLERDFIHLLEIDADVISYKEQPFKLRYALNGSIHTYTPDFLVERPNRKQVVEVKTEKDAEKEENKAVFKRAALICRKDGYEFIVATEKTIREQPGLGNVKLLHKYSGTPVSHEHQIHAYAFFVGKKEGTLVELIDFFASKGVGRQVVYALIYWGFLWIDLTTKPIGPESAVSMPMMQYALQKEKIA